MRLPLPIALASMANTQGSHVVWMTGKLIGHTEF